MGEISARRQSMSPQSKVNCSFRCLNIKEEHIGTGGLKPYPFWTTRAEYDALMATKSSNDVVLVIEDIEFEFVDHAEKPFVFLEMIARNLEHKGAFEYFNFNKKHLTWAKIGTENELQKIIHFLLEKNYVSSGKLGHALLEQLNEIMHSKGLNLTVGGWAAVKERNSGINSKKVFIAIKFGWPTTEEPLRLEVLRAIQEACDANGFVAQIVNQNTTGYITDQIIADIKNSRFLIAEYTHHNHGVYYEAGFAKGLGKSVFNLVREDHEKDFHFDVRQVNRRTWSTATDLKEKLRSWIAASIAENSLR
jgi:hypothetical protein